MVSVFLNITKDIHVLDVNQLFYNEIHYKIADDLYKYGLLDNKFTPDVKRIFYHHTIHCICEWYIKTNIRGVVVFYNYTQLEDCVLFQNFDQQDVLQLILGILQKMEKLLPVRIYCSRYSAGYLQIKCNENDGRVVNVLEKLKEISNNSRYTNNFEGIKKFTKKYGLLYLNRDYFQCLSTKCLYIK